MESSIWQLFSWGLFGDFFFQDSAQLPPTLPSASLSCPFFAFSSFLVSLSMVCPRSSPLVLSNRLSVSPRIN